MTRVRIQIPEVIREFPEKASGLSEALASVVRRRWPTQTIERTRAEFDLTEGEARGAVYRQASIRTINKIIRHPRGGVGLGLTLVEMVAGQRLEAFIRIERGKLADEQRKRNADLRALAEMSRSLSGVLGLRRGDGDGEGG